MEDRRTGVVDRILMRRNAEVLRFRCDMSRGAVLGKVDIIDRSLLPIGAFDCNGAFARSLFEK